MVLVGEGRNIWLGAVKFFVNICSVFGQKCVKLGAAMQRKTIPPPTPFSPSLFFVTWFSISQHDTTHIYMSSP